MLKSRLDHSTMDMHYFMAHARNEAKTLDEIQAVIDARRKLREFEQSLDEQLPSRKRLKKLRIFAQSLVEDHKYLQHSESQFGELRSDLNKQRLDRKVKQLEQENPDLDLTAIYSNDKTEAARKVMHKKAYASYKAYHFLKHGIKTGDDALKT